MSQKWTLFDARCLQDPSYRFRGVGQHSACVVKAGAARKQNTRFVAFTDAYLAGLADEHKELFDIVITAIPTSLHQVAQFIQLSPMTHPVQPILRILNSQRVFKASIVYDFIQLIYPERYLPTLTHRVDFVANLSTLQNYDQYVCISGHTAEELERHVPGSHRRTSVSGVAVRDSLTLADGEQQLPYESRRHIAIAGGGDPRKNPECAVVAHARSDVLQKMKVPLMIMGNYPPPMRDALRKLSREVGGSDSLILFSEHLSDPELRDIYQHALVTVIPSFAEGFSIPIVEANASGSPVLASDIGAHSELIPDRSQRFAPDKPDELRNSMEMAVASPDAWKILLGAQNETWRKFTADIVGGKFWTALSRTEVTGAIRSGVLHDDARSAPITGHHRPRVAIVSAWPPVLSGVGDYTAAFCREFGKLADVEVYTSSVDARPGENVLAVYPVSAEPYVASRFDATLSIIGNSHHSLDAFCYALDYGGAAVLHDARLIDFYYHQLGIERALKTASKEAHREVGLNELQHWLQNQSELKFLFLSEIVSRTKPCFVHSRVTANLISDLYERDPVVLPFAQYSGISPGQITPAVTRDARSKLNVFPDEKLVTVFGIVAQEKAPLQCVHAASLLKEQGRRIRLVFCGPATPAMRNQIEEDAVKRGLGGSVVTFESPVTREDYLLYLKATDLAIQLRTYKLGGLSGALNDCIAAAVPTVANRHLAESSDAPEYVVRVSDEISVPGLASAIETGLAQFPQRPIDRATAFSDEHSMARYSEKIFKCLFEGNQG